jgi:hypothetical protein
MEFYNDFKNFWLPIYKKQYFILKMQNNIEAIIAIKENIYRNWNLTREEKLDFIKQIGIKE